MMLKLENNEQSLIYVAAFKQRGQKLHPYAHIQAKAIDFQSVPECDLRGRGDRQCFLVFASDAKGPCRDCRACGRWYSDRRVSCLILSHSKFEKRTDGAEGFSRRVMSSSFCSGSLLGGEQMTGLWEKLDRESFEEACEAC
jgi:hypothetical protein